MKQDSGPDAGKFLAFGEPVVYRNATAAAWVELDDPSESCAGPSKVGISFELNGNSSTLFDWLDNLPNEYETAFNITNARGECKDNPLAAGCIPPNDLVAPEFPGTNTTFNPFVYVGVNWNPLGHPPMEVFNKAHFDFHFFMESQEDTNSIVPSETEPCTEGLSPASFFKANTPVPEGCFPGGYANLNAVAPFMGNHYIKLDEPVVAAAAAGSPDPSLWVDPAFIVGGYDGVITFLEPMVTRKQIQDIVMDSTMDEDPDAWAPQCYKTSVPAQYPSSGYYPRSFCLESDGNTSFLVYMTDFEWVEGGCGEEMDRMSYINALPPPPGTPALPAYCKAPLYEEGMSPAAAPQDSPTAPTTQATTGGVVISALAGLLAMFL